MDIEIVRRFYENVPPNSEIVQMKYSSYKKHYSDCKTVSGSYDSELKTIKVYIPNGRMKPSGVRGERYHYIKCKATDGQRVFEITYKAITAENAEKQHRKWCKKFGYTPVPFETPTTY